MTEILPTITSTAGDWREKIQEAAALGLKRVCFFPTMIPAAERPEACRLLEGSGIEEIPFVHLRSDFTAAEIDYFIRRFHTGRFNIHVREEYPWPEGLPAYRDRVYVENTIYRLDEDVKQWAGLCLDVSHLEAARLVLPPLYEHVLSLLATAPVGCWHVSAISSTWAGPPRRPDRHRLEKLSELDYAARYREWLPPVVAMELENSLTEQVEAAAYLKKLLEV